MDLPFCLFVVGCCVACFVSGFLWHKLLCRKIEKVPQCEKYEDVIKREG